MDYQTENFDPAPDEELICSICRCVFDNPVECPCRHVFCRSCITQWLSSHKNCPACRKKVSRSSLQDVIPIIKNMIMKLTVRCKNLENGCLDKPTVETYESHLKNCEFELVKCVNDGCKTKVLRKYVNKHEWNDCAYRHVTCTNCELKILYSDKRHNCVEELRNILKEKEDQIAAMKKEKESLLEELDKLKNKLKSKTPDFSSESTFSSGSDFGFEPEFSSDSLSSTDSEHHESARVSIYLQNNNNVNDSYTSLTSPIQNGVSHNDSSLQIVDSLTDDSLAFTSLNETSETKSPSVLVVDSTQHSMSPGTSGRRSEDSGADDFSDIRCYDTMADFHHSDGDQRRIPIQITRQHSSVKRRRYSPTSQVLQGMLNTVTDTAAEYFRNREQLLENIINCADSTDSSPCNRNVNRDCRKTDTRAPHIDNTSDNVTNVKCSSSSSGASTSSGGAARVTSTLSRNSKASGNKRKAKANKPKRKNSLIQKSTPDHSTHSPESSNSPQNTGNMLSLLQEYSIESSDPDWEPERHLNDSETGASDTTSPVERALCRDENSDYEPTSPYLLESEGEISSCSESLPFSSESSYEVKVPPTCSDLLNSVYGIHDTLLMVHPRYVNSSSEDDSDYFPPASPEV